MLSLSTLKFFKIPVVLIILGVLTFGFVCTGMARHASMHGTDMDSFGVVMSGTNQQECCNTGISKNIESWKSTLLVAPREVKDGLLLLLGLATAFAFVGLRFRHEPDDRGQLSYRFYIRDNPNILLFNQLRLAFARGILNPKIY